MAGLADRTDYHWGQMLKAALISTLLGIGAEFGDSDEDRLVRAIRRGGQDAVNETGRQVVERQLGVPTTLTIRPGFSLRVIRSEARRVGHGVASTGRTGCAPVVKK